MSKSTDTPPEPTLHTTTPPERVAGEYEQIPTQEPHSAETTVVELPEKHRATRRRTRPAGSDAHKRTATPPRARTLAAVALVLCACAATALLLKPTTSSPANSGAPAPGCARNPRTPSRRQQRPRSVEHRAAQVMPHASRVTSERPRPKRPRVSRPAAALVATVSPSAAPPSPPAPVESEEQTSGGPFSP
jgi:hypothetical protein